MQHNDDDIYESLTRETPEIRSQSLETVEAALRRELHNQHIDLFNVARAFGMIEDGLFRNLPGYKPGTEDDGNTTGLDDYYRAMPERLGVPKQTASHLRKVASAMNRHSMDFLAYDVDQKKVMTKLASLDRALKNHKGSRDEVFAHLVNDTVREFAKYSRGSDADPNDTPVQTSRPVKKRTIAHRALVPASELSEEQRSIAEALSRKHQVRASRSRGSQSTREPSLICGISWCSMYLRTV